MKIFVFITIRFIVEKIEEKNGYIKQWNRRDVFKFRYFQRIFLYFFFNMPEIVYTRILVLRFFKMNKIVSV